MRCRWFFVWDTLVWDTLVWDTLVWDTLVWDTLVWDTLVWDTLFWDIEMGETPLKRNVTVKDIIVVLLVAAALGIPIGWNWYQGTADAEMADGQEVQTGNRLPANGLGPSGMQPVAGMQGQMQANYRHFDSAAILNGVDVFASGNQDTLRTQKSGVVFHIQDVLVQQRCLEYTFKRDPNEKRQIANLRFCRRLTMMGNPNAARIEEKLKGLPAFDSIESEALPFQETQRDNGFEFSELHVKVDGQTTVLSGRVTNENDVRREYVKFYYEIFDNNEQLASGNFFVDAMNPASVSGFQFPVTAEVNPSDAKIKIAMEYSANRRLGPEGN